MTGVETTITVLGGVAVLVVNHLLTRYAGKSKADVGEVAALQAQANALARQNETLEKELAALRTKVDRLDKEVETCRTHRDNLLVERDRLSQQLVMLLLEREQRK